MRANTSSTRVPLMGQTGVGPMKYYEASASSDVISFMKGNGFSPRTSTAFGWSI